jgi:hypothetical protein
VAAPADAADVARAGEMKPERLPRQEPERVPGPPQVEMAYRPAAGAVAAPADAADVARAGEMKPERLPRQEPERVPGPPQVEMAHRPAAGAVPPTEEALRPEPAVREEGEAAAEAESPRHAHGGLKGLWSTRRPTISGQAERRPKASVG